MERITLEFYECEHNGDLDNYLGDLPRGCKIINKSINYAAEIGTVEIEVPDKKAFWDAFRETEAYEFLN